MTIDYSHLQFARMGIFMDIARVALLVVLKYAVSDTGDFTGCVIAYALIGVLVALLYYWVLEYTKWSLVPWAVAIITTAMSTSLFKDGDAFTAIFVIILVVQLSCMFSVWAYVSSSAWAIKKAREAEQASNQSAFPNPYLQPIPALQYTYEQPVIQQQQQVSYL